MLRHLLLVDRVFSTLAALDARDRGAGEARQFLAAALVARVAEPAQGFVAITRGVGVQAEVVMRELPQRWRPGRFLQRLACANVLARLVMRNAGVVVQQRGIHPRLGSLLVAQQSGPVKVVTKKPVAVPE